MVKKETKNYQTPTIKVVQFKVELGHYLSGDQETSGGVTRTIDFMSVDPMPDNDKYIQSNDWNGFTEL